MRIPEEVPFEVPEWSSPSSPFSKKTHDFYRPEDLKASAQGKTPRTAFFEENLVLFARELDGRVPFKFITPSGDVRSLDRGCLRFLMNRPEPELELELDANRYIVAVRPRPMLVERYHQIASLQTPLDVDTFVDDRRKQFSEQVIREGSAEFRRRVLNAYHGRCALTGTRVKQVLDAAHIFPYLGIETNDVRNGIALRADVHRLFDSHLISLDLESEVLVVRVAADLAGTLYGKLAGKAVHLPADKAEQPCSNCLRKHLASFLARNSEKAN